MRTQLIPKAKSYWYHEPKYEHWYLSSVFDNMVSDFKKIECEHEQYEYILDILSDTKKEHVLNSILYQSGMKLINHRTSFFEKRVKEHSRDEYDDLIYKNTLIQNLMIFFVIILDHVNKLNIELYSNVRFEATEDIDFDIFKNKILKDPKKGWGDYIYEEFLNIEIKRNGNKLALCITIYMRNKSYTHSLELLITNKHIEEIVNAPFKVFTSGKVGIMITI